MEEIYMINQSMIQLENMMKLEKLQQYREMIKQPDVWEIILFSMIIIN